MYKHVMYVVYMSMSTRKYYGNCIAIPRIISPLCEWRLYFVALLPLVSKNMPQSVMPVIYA